ncbi:MAG: ATP phosphoribosyltransferase, partial [Nitrospinales bacterium]
WKAEKVDRLVLMLKGAMNANGKVGIMMNIPKSSLDAVLKVLPERLKPTISELSDSSWVDINVILDEKSVRELVPDLKQAGAADIVEYPLNKVIP